MFKCRKNAHNEKLSDAAKLLPDESAHPGLHFIPFAFDIGGGVDKAAMDFLKELAPLDSAKRPIVNKYLRLIAKVIARSIVQLSWWPTMTRVSDELYEYDSDASDGELVVVDADSDDSFDQEIPPEVALQLQLQANPGGPNLLAPWQQIDQEEDNAMAHAVGLDLLDQLNDPPAPFAAGVFHDLINESPFGPAAPAVDADLDDGAAFPAVEAASDDDDG
jgi:hypothetical protein